MAIQNPSTLYSFGNVQLDSSPGVQMFTQLMARKQAKEEALDQYDRERLNSINDKGLRDRDRPGLDNKINEIRNYYNQNKQQIRKGGAAQFNYEKMYRDLNGYINRSKERTARQEAGMKLYNDRFKIDGRIPDDFIAEMNANDLPLDDEKGKELDLNKWLASPKPFNQQTHLKKYADLKRSPGVVSYEKIPDNPLKLNEVTVEKFDDGAKQVIAARSANDYENSYSFASQVQEEMKDPIARARLEKTFQKEFGTQPLTPTDYATAFNLEILQPELRKVKAIDNREELMKRQQEQRKEMAAIRFENQKELANLRASLGLYAKDQQAQILGDRLNEFVDNQVSVSSAKPVYNWMGKLIGYDVQASPTALSAFEEKEGGKTYAPSQVLWNPEKQKFILRGNGFEAELTRDEYQTSLSNKILNTRVKIEQTKSKGTSTTTPAQKPIQLKGSYTAPNGKIYNEQELLKMYTPDQIQQAIKDGKLKKN